MRANFGKFDDLSPRSDSADNSNSEVIEDVQQTSKLMKLLLFPSVQQHVTTFHICQALLHRRVPSQLV
jgi:hypothetical protein